MPFGVEFAALAPYLPYAVGLAVAGLTLAVFATRRRGSAARGYPQPAPPAGDEALDPTLADRRGAVRREGPPVKVLVSAPVLQGKVATGWVLDRSTGGMRLALPGSVPPGSSMQVRAVNAPDTIPWVTVLVRSCRKNGDVYELGCEFEQTPPWNVLLLFG